MKNRLLKRVALWTAVLVMALCALPAQAEFGTLYMVVNCAAAPLYASPYAQNSAVLRYVNMGEIVYCISALEGQLCVGYENSLGYMDAANLAAVNDEYYSFRLPGGDIYSSGGSYTDYYGVPYFTHIPLPAKATQKLAMRTGPGTEYTDAATYDKNTEIAVYYETSGSGVSWVYIGFTYRGQDYLLYTGEKRVKTDYDLNGTEEKAFSALITQAVTPRLGPGSNYALAEHSVPSGSSVRGIFRSVDGWLMFDYRLEDGRIQRAWAPPMTWQ